MIGLDRLVKIVKKSKPVLPFCFQLFPICQQLKKRPGRLFVDLILSTMNIKIYVL